MCIFVVLCVDETLFYMREYSDAIKLPVVGRDYRLSNYILTNFMLYARGNFKNVTIYIWQYIHILH
jgi:hypothetical protein